jgi:hypothetical protein
MRFTESLRSSITKLDYLNSLHCRLFRKIGLHGFSNIQDEIVWTDPTLTFVPIISFITQARSH